MPEQHRQLLVDLSNVCRDENLIGPGVEARWDALLRVLGAINTLLGTTSHPAISIADRSLFSKLDDNGRQHFRTLERSGQLEVRELADEDLLDYAFSDQSPYKGSYIVSHDRFADFRRRYPEIQGCRDRFIGWRVRNDGSVEAFFRDMGFTTHDTMSRKEESGEFKARRLRHDDVLSRASSHFYACENRACILAKLWPAHLPELPLYDDRSDAFVCPGCRQGLGQKDLRPKAAQLIVFLDGDERLRILLQEGESIFVGRVDGTNCVGLQRTISTERLRGISREHLKFSYIGDEITVVDPGSKNGTQIRSKRAGNRGLSAEPTRLGRSESLELPDGITIELSGRSQPFAGERPVDTPNAADAEVTRLRGGE